MSTAYWYSSSALSSEVGWDPLSPESSSAKTNPGGGGLPLPKRASPPGSAAALPLSRPTVSLESRMATSGGCTWKVHRSSSTRPPFSAAIAARTFAKDESEAYSEQLGEASCSAQLHPVSSHASSSTLAPPRSTIAAQAREGRELSMRTRRRRQRPPLTTIEHS